MIKFKAVYFFILMTNFTVFSQQNDLYSKQLSSLIEEYQNHKGYDREAYPLGNYSKDYYKSEAEFAEKISEKLSNINTENLKETEQISAELLKFVLQDKIDYYKFERFLNPLLSDAGFHSSLNYQIRPLHNYWSVKEYLKKLNSLPEFVNQHFKNLREGLEKGVSQPKIIFKGYETILCIKFLFFNLMKIYSLINKKHCSIFGIVILHKKIIIFEFVMTMLF